MFLVILGYYEVLNTLTKLNELFNNRDLVLTAATTE